MKKLHSASLIVIAILLVMTPMVTFAGGKAEAAVAYPTKPVTIIVPFSAGGGTDVIFRAVSAIIERYWGQPLVVVNRPGAGGTVGTSIAAKAPADGYTLLAALQGPLILNPLQMSVDYSVEDFDHVVQMVSNPLAFLGRADSPFANMVDLVNFARANPGRVNIGTTGIGNLPHLMTLRLQQLTGIKFTIVPMDGSAPALRELLAGNIDGYIDTALTHIMKGSGRGLAVLSQERHQSVPDVPTVVELGFPKLVSDAWFGVSVPAGVPEPIQRKIADTMERVANNPEFQTMMRNAGNDVVFLNRVEFQAKIDELAAFFPGFLTEMGMRAR